MAPLDESATAIVERPHATEPGPLIETDDTSAMPPGVV